MMKESQTPLGRQYNQIKQKYPNTILLFRLGDFFETFGDDAVITAQVCGITLTKRNNGAGADTPLAGFPYHQLDAYLPKIVKAGHRVAVCEQLEDPKKAKGIVKRGVVEVVTPGVALYDKLLETKSNNYIISLYAKDLKSYIKQIGIAITDISTGEFSVTEIESTKLNDVLVSLNPAEILVSKEQKDYFATELTAMNFKTVMTKVEHWIFEYNFTLDILLRHFKINSLKGFGIDELNYGISAAGALLNYVSETQNSVIGHISTINRYNVEKYMQLDKSTRRNLEILFSQTDNNSSSLVSVIDKTITPQGSRMIRKWLSMPLVNREDILKRQNSVTYFYDNDNIRKDLQKLMQEIGDIERLITKICTARANPRDVVSLKNSLAKIPLISEILKSSTNAEIINLINNFLNTDNVVELIQNSFIDDPTAQLGTGRVFRDGYDEDLDSYLTAKYSAKKWLDDYQEKEKRRTEIPSLKVGFTSVFGYYIEITNTHVNKIPENYSRKQTLRNAERYITDELKEFETKILNAEEKISEIENSLFNQLINKIAESTKEIQHNAIVIATIDCLQSLAEIAKINNYVIPEITDDTVLELINARHPVVEKLLKDGEHFTPNSTEMNTKDNMIHIITGPNMSGKSCYLRQVAVNVLLAQIGGYVAADSAKIGVVDKIFTRIGAQDNITAGESTFLVEMQEAANIMNNATERSLILLDEVGRGTATFDGISIAWSIAEHIHNKINAKTLFATHYHELNDLSERYNGIKNFKVEVIETGSDIIFSHNVVSGASDYSFGIHVAKMAGMPYEVISRADEIMATLDEEKHGNERKSKPDMKSIKTTKPKHSEDQLAIFEFRDDEMRQRIAAIKIDHLTPVQAFNMLVEFHREALKKQ
ncbi:MAG: DNA mismatch repair protein MutS [Desulfobulbaceae bacterium]|nr:DNA mismatch repair protein MutS [Desulfobulbaceae bacterium]